MRRRRREGYVEGGDYEWEAVMQGRKEGMEHDRLEKEKSISDEITKEQFYKYVRVQTSGITNMFDVGRVHQLSGLHKDTIFKIMETYGELLKKYPEVKS